MRRQNRPKGQGSGASSHRDPRSRQPARTGSLRRSVLGTPLASYERVASGVTAWRKWSLNSGFERTCWVAQTNSTWTLRTGTSLRSRKPRNRRGWSADRARPTQGASTPARAKHRSEVRSNPRVPLPPRRPRIHQIKRKRSPLGFARRNSAFHAPGQARSPVTAVAVKDRSSGSSSSAPKRGGRIGSLIAPTAWARSS